MFTLFNDLSAGGFPEHELQEPTVEALACAITPDGRQVTIYCMTTQPGARHEPVLCTVHVVSPTGVGALHAWDFNKGPTGTTRNCTVELLSEGLGILDVYPNFSPKPTLHTPIGRYDLFWLSQDWFTVSFVGTAMLLDVSTLDLPDVLLTRLADVLIDIKDLQLYDRTLDVFPLEYGEYVLARLDRVVSDIKLFHQGLRPVAGVAVRPAPLWCIEHLLRGILPYRARLTSHKPLSGPQMISITDSMLRVGTAMLGSVGH